MATSTPTFSPTDYEQLPPFILASTSPRRSQLLHQLELNFQVIPSEALEFNHLHLTPSEVAQLNAHRKARAVSKKYPDALVLGADTLVCLGTQVFGKPENSEEARQTLQKLSGQSHQVVTGVSMVQLRTHHEVLFVESTRVTFKRLTDSVIEEYLRKVDVQDKAGSYALQEHGDLLIEEVEGSRTNVVGLPLERVREVLEHWPVNHG